VSLEKAPVAARKKAYFVSKQVKVPVCGFKCPLLQEMKL
jgi:adenine-specific DNA methylase